MSGLHLYIPGWPGHILIDKPVRLTIRVLWVLAPDFCQIRSEKANRETVTS